MTARLVLGLLVMGWAATPVAAQFRSPRYEIGPQALALVDDPAYVGGGLYAAVRPGGNARVALTGSLGAADGQVLTRGELLAEFLLNPRRARGVSPYGFGGVALMTGEGTTGYLVLGLGLETAPRARSGWAIEAGVGGGVRLTVGWRRRW